MMMKTMKALKPVGLRVALCLAMLILVCAVTVAACGEDLPDGITYDFSREDWDGSHGVLVISGTGDLPAFANSDDTPWAQYKDEIDQIVIESGITGIGAYAFADIPNKVRVDFNENTAPTIDDNAFLKTDGVIFRYYTEDVSWPTDESWIYLPLDNQDGKNDRVYYSATDGWYMYDGDDKVTMSAAQAKEITYRSRQIELWNMPSNEAFALLCNDWSVTWGITFIDDCSGTVNLVIPKRDSPKASVQCASDSMTVNITAAEGMGSLYVSAGNVTCEGDIEDLHLRTPNGNQGATVTITGSVASLAVTGGDKWDAYQGSLILNGLINEGYVYSSYSLEVPNVSEPIEFEHMPVADLCHYTYGETETLISDGEISIDSDEFLLKNYYFFSYKCERDQWYIGLTPRDGYSHLDSPVDVSLANYKADFSASDIGYGQYTNVTLIDNTGSITLDGEINELSVDRSTVIVNGPTWSVYEPYESYDITINNEVQWLYANGNDPDSRITLGSGGSAKQGYRNRRLRGTAYFGPVSGPCDLLSDGQLGVLSWKDGQTIKSILPSDSTVTEAAGQTAILDLEQRTYADLSPDELTAIGSVNNDDEPITGVLDLTVYAYTVDGSGNCEKGDTISNLTSAVPITVEGTAYTHVVRLHDEDGTAVATELETTFDRGKISFESDLFSKYVLLSNDPKPVISIQNADSITRGEFVPVTIVEGIEGDDIYYRAYVLRDYCTLDDEDAILEQCWGGADELCLPTEALLEGENYDVFVQAYSWDDVEDEDVPVGIASEPVTITIAQATGGEHTVTIRTNRGNSTDPEDPTQVDFGRGVNYTVYAPGAYKLFVYSGNQVWWFGGEFTNSSCYSETDFTLQAMALYDEYDENNTQLMSRSDVLYFDVTEPGGEMSSFGCQVVEETTPEQNKLYKVNFGPSSPTPDMAQSQPTVYKLNMWDMTFRGEHPEDDDFDYDEPVYTSGEYIPADVDSYFFEIPAAWGDGGEWSLIPGHAYIVEVEAWVEDVPYRSALAHTAFVVAEENPPLNLNTLTLSINRSPDDCTIPAGTDFDIQINAQNAVNVRVFDGERYDYLSEYQEWGRENGWAAHPEDIRYGANRTWPISYAFWAEAQYEEDGTWYRSNVVVVTVTSAGTLSAPGTITLSDSSVTRGDYVEVTVSDFDDRTEWVSARLLYAAAEKPYEEEACVGDAFVDRRGRNSVTLYVPTAGALKGDYRLAVECGAQGYEGGTGNAWVTVTEDEQADDLILTFSKEPGNDGKIHILPHEDLGVSVWYPMGYDNPRVALYVDDREEDSEDGILLTKDWNSDRNGEYKFRAAAWSWYDHQSQNEQVPDYTVPEQGADPVTVVVEGDELSDPQVRVDPVLYPWEASNTDQAVEFSFTAVKDKQTQQYDAETYRIDVENVTGNDRFNVWSDNINAAELMNPDPGAGASEGNATYKDGVFTYSVPMVYENGNEVFRPGDKYSFNVSASAYGMSTSDGSAEALVIVDNPLANVSMSVANVLAAYGGDASVSVQANAQYRVVIECEGATMFEFYDGENWNEVRHCDNINPTECDEVGEQQAGRVVFNWSAGNSGNYYLTSRVKSPNDGDWTQGPVIRLEVTGQEMTAANLLYELWADGEELTPDPDTGAYSIIRGTPLVVKLPPENPSEIQGSWYGVHLIGDDGWHDYYHWNDQEREVVYPTADIKAGTYEVRIAASAPGYDTYVPDPMPKLKVSDAEPHSGVFLSLDMDQTQTCQANPIKVYAPGASHITVYMTENDNEQVCDFSGESGTDYWYQRGSSGVYHVYAVAVYDYQEDMWSEELTWTVEAPNGPLARQRIDAPAVLAPDTPLTFTVHDIPNAQNWSVEVVADNGHTVWRDEGNSGPGAKTVPYAGEDPDGEAYQFESGKIYAIKAYASAYGFDDAYLELPFVVAEPTGNTFAILIFDEDNHSVDTTATDGSDLNEGLWTGRNYRIKVSGSEPANCVLLYYNNNQQQYETAVVSDKGASWEAFFPQDESQYWNTSGGTYNLVAKIEQDDDVCKYVGLPVTVQYVGQLRKPSVTVNEPDATVTRGNLLHVHIDGVEHGQNYNVSVRGYNGPYNQNGTGYYCAQCNCGDIEIPTVNLPVDPETTYRVEVSVGADGYDGNGDYAEFTVVEPQQQVQEPILSIQNENDLWVKEDLKASVYAPGADNAWIEISSDTDRQFGRGGGNYAVLNGGWAPNRSGKIVISGVAQYTVEVDGEDRMIEKRVERTCDVHSIGQLGAPEISAPVLTESTMTFSFNYSALPQILAEWGWEGDFDYADLYTWRVDKFSPDQYGSWSWITIKASEGGEPRGKTAHPDITVTTQDGYQYDADGVGIMYRIEVSAWARRCEDNQDSRTVSSNAVTSGSVTLAVAAEADPSTPLDQLVRNENLKLTITAPANSEVQLFDGIGFGWEGVWEFEQNEGDATMTATLDRRYEVGSYDLVARAKYADTDGDPEIWHESVPVRIRVKSYGTLEMPTVAVPESVQRGEFLTVNIGMNDPEDPEPESYRLQVESYNGYDWSPTNVNEDNLQNTPCALNTTSLQPGTYRVKVQAVRTGWHDSDSGTAGFTVTDTSKPDDNGFVITGPAEAPATCDDWTVNAYYKGNTEDCQVMLVREDGRAWKPDEQDVSYHSEGSDYAWATWNDTVSGTARIHAVAYKDVWSDEAGENIRNQIATSHPIEVNIVAENNNLEPIDVEGVAGGVLVLEDDNDPVLRVRVDAAADFFDLDLRRSDGIEVISDRFAATPEERDDEGYVTVPLPRYMLQEEEGYVADIFTCARTYNEARKEIRFVVASQAPSEDVTLTVLTDPEDCLMNGDIEFAIQAEGAQQLRVCDETGGGSGWINGSSGTVTHRFMGEGDLMIWAEAYSGDPSLSIYEMEKKISAVQVLTLKKIGTMAPPTVTFGEGEGQTETAEVDRGDFLTVNIGPVQGARSYGLKVEPAPGDENASWEGTFDWNNLDAGPVVIPTASLKHGQYVVRVWAEAAGYDSEWSGDDTGVFTVSEPELQAGEEFVVSLSNDAPTTYEQVWMAAYYVGDDADYVQMSLSDGARFDEGTDQSRSDNAIAAATFNHSGTYTLTVEARSSETGQPVASVERVITVSVEEGNDLDIALTDVPDYVVVNREGPTTFDVKVRVDQRAEFFNLRVFGENNDTCDEQNDLKTSDAVNGIYTAHVSIPVGYLADNTAYWVNVHTYARGYDDGGDQTKFLAIHEAPSEDVELELLDNPDDLWTSVDMHFKVTAEGASYVRLFDEYGLRTGEQYGEQAEYISYRMGSGEHFIRAVAYCLDDTTKTSAPMRINVKTRGPAVAPTVMVDVSYKQVPLGEMATVNIGAVEGAESYELLFYWSRPEEDEDGGGTGHSDQYEGQLSSAGEHRIPTAGMELEVGDRVYVVARVHVPYYDDNQSDTSEQAVFTVVKNESDEDLVLSVSNDQPTTGELWNASAYYKGDQDDVEVEIDITDGLNEEKIEGGSGNYRLKWWRINHAADYTVRAEAYRCGNEGREVIAEAETVVHVHADDNNNLDISLSAMPAIVAPGESLSIPVTVDANVERFNLSIRQDGQEIYQLYDKRATGAGVVNVPLNNVDLAANNAYTVGVYTWRYGWNDDYDEATFIVTDKTPAEDGEIVLTADPQNDWIASRPLWLCYSAEGADQMRLMSDGWQTEIDSAYFAGPKYYCYNGEMENTERTFWVEAHYQEGDVWKVGKPLTGRFGYDGMLAVPSVTLKSNEVQRGTPLRATIGEVDGAERYQLKVNRFDAEGNDFQYIFDMKYDEPGAVLIPTVELEPGDYLIQPMALAERYSMAGAQEEDWIAFTVTDVAEGTQCFYASATEIQVNDTIDVALFVKGARDVMITQNDPDGAQYEDIEVEWATEYGYSDSLYVRDRRIEDLDNFTLYGWYTLDGENWQRVQQPLAITVASPAGELDVDGVELMAPDELHQGDTLVFSVSGCDHADGWVLGLVREGFEIASPVFEGDTFGRDCYENTQDQPLVVGATYSYRLTLWGKGYASKQVPLNKTLTILGPNEVCLASPSIAPYIPVVRKGDELYIYIAWTDENAEQSGVRIEDEGDYCENVNADQDGTIRIDTGDLNMEPGNYSLTIGSYATGCVPGEQPIGSVRIVDPQNTLLLPSALKVIGEEAFEGMTAEIVEIPEGTTTIGKKAFAGCTELGIVSIPDTVTSIAPDAFEGCNYLVFECSANSAAATFAEDHDFYCDAPSE